MAGIKFRILLDSSQKEEVFCDILISLEDNFESLFNAIVEAYSFKGDQMASFYVSNENWDKGEEISLMDVNFGDGSEQKIMSTTSIGSCLQEQNQKFILVYDFLKMWIFLIECIGVQQEAPKKPELLLSIGSKPQEDSKELDEGMQMPGEASDDDDDDDEFGFNDFEDGFSEEDLNPYI